MSVQYDADGRRSVQAEVEVPGTPEQVWQAIATGPGISSWFVPSEVDERVGGKAVSTFGPGMESAGTITAISAATGPLAPTGIHTMTRSASLTASALVSTTRSAMPSSTTRLRVAAERAVATIERTTPYSRAARAIEPPISPTPMMAIWLKTGPLIFPGIP